MPEFIIDACLPRSSTKLLRELGYDAVDAREVSLGRTEDADISAYAQKEGRILVTRDKGFGNLLQYPLGSHQGIVVLRLPSTYTANQINKVLKKFLEDVKVEKLKKRLAVVELARYRLRGP